jgi:signal transduction histidine kinase
MQAQPSSILAARIPSKPSTSTRKPHPASALAPPNSRALMENLLAPLAVPSTGLADSTGLAHDAGNFLVALGLYCDLLSAPGVLRPEHKHYADELTIISNVSSKLIRRLLAGDLGAAAAAAQPDSSAPLSRSVLNRRNTRSTDVITTPPNHAFMLRCLAPVLKRIAAGAADVSVTCPGSLPALQFPSEIIERITVNLVRNAAEAIRNDRSENPSVSPFGAIRVSLLAVGPHVQLTVEDNGPGMTPAMVAEFLHPSPLPTGATRGLGHRIVQELAAASAGELSVEAHPDNGTMIRLKWPVLPIAPVDASNMPSVGMSSPPVANVSIEGSDTC